jgi:hypothetical protein
MIKKEAFNIMQYVKVFYERFEINQEKINAWYNVLQAEDFQEVRKIVEVYARTNKFPPTVAELLPTKQLNGVMSVEQTRAHLDKLEREREAAKQQSKKIDFPKDFKAFQKFMAEREKGETE